MAIWRLPFLSSTSLCGEPYLNSNLIRNNKLRRYNLNRLMSSIGIILFTGTATMVSLRAELREFRPCQAKSEAAWLSLINASEPPLRSEARVCVAREGKLRYD